MVHYQMHSEINKGQWDKNLLSYYKMNEGYLVSEFLDYSVYGRKALQSTLGDFSWDFTTRGAVGIDMYKGKSNTYLTRDKSIYFDSSWDRG